MRKISGILILAICLGVSKMTLAATAMKIGYVDVAAVFDQYSETKKNKQGLEKEIKVKQDLIKKMGEELKKMRDTLQSQEATVTPEEKQKKNDEIDRKSQELQKYTEEAESDLRKRESELTAEILKKIYQAIDQIGKEKEFTFILDKNNVLYGVDSSNVTSEVLNRLENVAKGSMVPSPVIPKDSENQSVPEYVPPIKNPEQGQYPGNPRIRED